MKTIRGIAYVVFGLGMSAAHADVKLQNKDAKAHDVMINCKSMVTVQRSIQPGTIMSIGDGPCEVTVKSTGAKMSGSGNQLMTIEKSPEKKSTKK